ncbi:MAG TPA: hypothetical protein VMJ31_07365 [Methylocystis sp.]|nr:hypothetical protein [Methylocystis sp.]
MRWSELKRRVEGNFAPTVRGRVEVFTTSQRNAQDGAAEGWITIDGARVGPAASVANGQLFRSDEDFKRALFSSLTLSLDAMLASKDALLHALAVLDRRFDKLRLESFNPRGESELTRQLYAFRCAAEGLPHYADALDGGARGN